MFAIAKFAPRTQLKIFRRFAVVKLLSPANLKSLAVQKLREFAVVRVWSRSCAVAAKFSVMAFRSSKVGVVAHAAQSLSQVCNSAVVVGRKSKSLQPKICVAIVRLRQGSN